MLLQLTADLPKLKSGTIVEQPLAPVQYKEWDTTND